jgi:hypothetical protein
VKGISPRATLISLLLGLAAVTPGQAEDYYVYQTPNGALVVSNKEPPPGSKIIRRHKFPDVADTEVSQGQETGKPQPAGSPKPSKEK